MIDAPKKAVDSHIKIDYVINIAHSFLAIDSSPIRSIFEFAIGAGQEFWQRFHYPTGSVHPELLHEGCFVADEPQTALWTPAQTLLVASGARVRSWGRLPSASSVAFRRWGRGGRDWSVERRAGRARLRARLEDGGRGRGGRGGELHRLVDHRDGRAPRVQLAFGRLFRQKKRFQRNYWNAKKEGKSQKTNVW